MNITNTKENMIQDYDAVLDARYGKEGSPERIKFEEDAYAYYSGLILRDARKEAKVSQAELAKRTQTTKSYISRIENGLIIPSVAVFYRMVTALGMSVQIVKSIPIRAVVNETPRYSGSYSDALTFTVKYTETN